MGFAISTALRLAGVTAALGTYVLTLDADVSGIEDQVRVNIADVRGHGMEYLLRGQDVLFNLAGIIRNRLKCPELFPPKAKIRIHCFAFILDPSEGFILAVLLPRRGRMADLRHRLQAMRNCWFLYEPWRVRPRICQFPPSTFVRQKSTAQQAEYDRCQAVCEDMRLLGICYGQIDP